MDGFRAACGGLYSGGCERVPVVISGQLESSVAKNNQLRTGADKGNPTV
jgi:hypothetical protein